MDDAANDLIRVIVAMDFSDAIIEQLRGISPRLHIERHFPTVPENLWEDTEVLYTLTRFPEPAQAPRLRWIQLHFAGVDHTLKQPIVQAEDVEVTTASGETALFGDSSAIAYKLAVWAALSQQARSRGINYTTIDLRYGNRPVLQ